MFLISDGSQPTIDERLNQFNPAKPVEVLYRPLQKTSQRLRRAGERS